jgi:prepilin-type N-terminal cleavage/methylation domain-containing protein
MRARDRGPQRGFSLLELAAALAILLAAAGVLLWRLGYYQEAAEQARVEYTANTLKLALQLHVADLLAQQTAVDYAALARENPVNWLETPMPGYRGEVGPDEATRMPRGSWYFDRERREVVYLPLRDAYLAAGESGEKRLRFQVQALPAEGGRASVAVRFGPVQPYRWLVGGG